MKKLAIIGASTGQKQLCLNARSMNDVESYCIAWEKGAVCKDIVDHFIPISITEKDKIVDYCKDVGIDGVVSNASELTAQVSSYVAEKLKLLCTPYKTILDIQDKSYVREKTKNIDGLGKIKTYVLPFSYLKTISHFPCVVKPIIGSAKKGVNFIENKKSLEELVIPNELEGCSFIVEQYVSGKEVSVESLSFHGKHQVIQITDKVTTGAPHFVELGHLQPTSLSNNIIKGICEVIPLILDSVGFTNGASHTEMKITSNNEIYLIEINPRGGGDEISNTLVEETTNCNYVREMINIALNDFSFKDIKNISYSGIYFLCKQNERLLKYYYYKDKYPFIVSAEYDGLKLKNSMTNYDRNGYILYKSKNKRIEL
jgi:biotin carboxylase